jgi:hypothetical protein
MQASFRETLRGRAGYATDTAQGAVAHTSPRCLAFPVTHPRHPMPRRSCRTKHALTWMGLSA